MDRRPGAWHEHWANLLAWQLPNMIGVGGPWGGAKGGAPAAAAASSLARAARPPCPDEVRRVVLAWTCAIVGALRRMHPGATGDDVPREPETCMTADEAECEPEDDGASVPLTRQALDHYDERFARLRMSIDDTRFGHPGDRCPDAVRRVVTDGVQGILEAVLAIRETFSQWESPYGGSIAKPRLNTEIRL